MFSRIVSLVAAGGAAELHRIQARAVLGLFAVIALIIAFGFGMLGLFIWLTLHMAGWQAALLAAFLALVLAGLFLLARRSAGRRPPRQDIAAQIEAVLSEVTREDGDTKPMARVTGALAAGIVIGRMLSR